MHRARLSVLALLLCTATAAGGIEARLPRHPAPSPDGSEIAFSWQGDIWSVSSRGGRAMRLTAHPALDRHPVWSRDGRWIAFASNRHGNLDVFVLPADASSAPRRLTHASVDDVPVDFHPDGQRVLFTSRRHDTARKSTALYHVPLAGGTPALAQTAAARWAAWAPSGTELLSVRGNSPALRHGYRGSGNRDLWVRDAGGGYLRLTTFQGDDDHPTWTSSGGIVFLSERTGRKNLHRLDPASGRITTLTGHEGSDVRSPRASLDGNLVAYEFEDGLWVLDLHEGRASGAPRRLSIEVAAAAVLNPVERRADSSGAREFAVSPDGKLAAFVVRGEVFVAGISSKEDQEVAPPPTVRVTSTPRREKDLAWSPDGAHLYFASDRAGAFDIWRARPKDEEAGWTGSFEFPAERLTDSPRDETKPRLSPDGETMVYLRGRGTLVAADPGGGKERTLFRDFDTPHCDWSPDSRWLACSRTDMDYNVDVWLVPLREGDPYNLSRHPDEDQFPRWSPDGRRVLWLSKRHAWSFDVWGAWLREEDHRRTPEEWLAHWKDSGGEAGGKKQEDGEDEAPPDVVIDLDRLWERSTPVTSLPGNEGWAFSSADGKRVFFKAEVRGKTDLFSVRWDGENLERLTKDGKDPGAPRLSADGKTIYFLSKGKIQRIDTSGKSGDPVPFAARYEIDRAAEREAVFHEAWRALEEWFYDPEFHGADWGAERDRYLPWALAASHPEDFQDVMNLMQGELNASHLRYRNPRGEGGETTGWTGALFDPEAGGPGLLVRRVLPDSPADRHDVALEPGERILVVAGEEVGPGVNIHALLAETAGTRVPFLVRNGRGRKRTVVLKPVTDGEMRTLRYRDWRQGRREMVESLSDGRLGYIHVQSMGIPSFEEFERDLYAAANGREGLVIDVRGNGGGWTTDYLLAVLEVRRHARTVPRGGDPAVAAYPQGRLPLAAWTRPAVALCNEESFSNAEIFSHAFKSLGRGLLVGMPTFGGVISTGGTDLVNGGWVRLPLRGWWVAGTGLNMENNGAVPDLVVPQPPSEDILDEGDAQLEAAVRAFLDRIEDDPRHGSW